MIARRSWAEISQMVENFRKSYEAAHPLPEYRPNPFDPFAGMAAQNAYAGEYSAALVKNMRENLHPQDFDIWQQWTNRNPSSGVSSFVQSVVSNPFNIINPVVTQQVEHPVETAIIAGAILGAAALAPAAGAGTAATTAATTTAEQTLGVGLMDSLLTQGGALATAAGAQVVSEVKNDLISQLLPQKETEQQVSAPTLPAKSGATFFDKYKNELVAAGVLIGGLVFLRKG